MKRFLLVFSFLVLLCSAADAQRKSFIPKDDSAEYDEELEEEVRKETQILQSQPSDKEQQRMIRHRDKRKEKEYKKHHKEIQDKKTQKNMKKSKKKSEAYNQHKMPWKSKRTAKKKARRR
ncbi:MAG: hypothetical protein MJ198_03055 [Bacteroidales bacterium]|nr:hypothetical protein [Bacteroidales bacterium]